MYPSPGSSLFVHLRTPVVAPLTRPLAYGDSSTPRTYCGRSGVPSGLSGSQLEDEKLSRERLGAKGLPELFQAKLHEDSAQLSLYSAGPAEDVVVSTPQSMQHIWRKDIIFGR